MALAAQNFVPGQTYFDPNNHIEYRAGNLPVIVCAPHGGDLNPSAIPNRTCPNAVTVNDGNTQVLVRQIDSALQVRLGCYPHIVICRLSRRKLDANRGLEEGACGNTTAGLAWAAYHGFVDSAKAAVNARFQKGLLLDMHGHAHDIDRLELGYLLSSSQLQWSDSLLNLPQYVQQSSIRNLIVANQPAYTHAQLLRGAQALGTQLALRGVPSVPSQTAPFPLSGEAYFNGGYTTARHGSANGGTIDAIQIECHFEGLRDTYQNRRKFADTLSCVLEKYLETLYFGDIFQPEITGDGTACAFNTYQYQVAALPGSTYTWIVQGGELLSGQGTPQATIRWFEPGGGSVSVIRSCPP